MNQLLFFFSRANKPCAVLGFLIIEFLRFPGFESFVFVGFFG